MTTNPLNTTTNTIGNMAFERWEKAAPVDASHPDEERQVDGELIVPLYDESEIVNILTVRTNGSESTFAAEITPKGRQTARLIRAKTSGVVAVAGRVEESTIHIPGAMVSGEEQHYLCGRLANATHVFLTEGWRNAKHIFDSTGIPAVATLNAHHQTSAAGTGAKNFIDIALRLREVMPAEALMTVAINDDRTAATKEAKRQADIVARQTEEEAQKFSDGKGWKQKETREQADRAKEQALTVTLYDAAAYVANRIGARLVVLKNDS